MKKEVVVALLLILATGCSKRELLMSSAAMEPTIKQGSKVTVDFSAYETEMVKRGDLVCFVPLEYPDQLFVFRVVGLPNETIELKDGTVFANGTATGIGGVANTEFGSFPMSLKDNEYLVLGDNTREARDSRYFGPINASRIKGKVINIQPDSGGNEG